MPALSPARPQPPHLSIAAAWFTGSAISSTLIASALTFLSGEPDALLLSLLALRPIMIESALSTTLLLLALHLLQYSSQRTLRSYSRTIAFLTSSFIVATLAFLFDKSASALSSTFNAFPRIGVNEADTLFIEIVICPLLLTFILLRPSTPSIITDDPPHLRRKRLFLRSVTLASFLICFGIWAFSKTTDTIIAIPRHSVTHNFFLNSGGIVLQTEPTGYASPSRFYLGSTDAPLTLSSLLPHFSFSISSGSFSLSLWPLVLSTALLTTLAWRKPRSPSQPHFPISPTIPLASTST